MSFKLRLALVAAAAVALAVVLASAVSWVVVRNELYRELDSGLENQAAQISRFPVRVEEGPDGRSFLAIPRSVLGEGGYVQAVRSNGETIRSFFDVALPVDARVLGVARGKGDSFFTDAPVDGEKSRVLTTPFAPGYALQLSRPLSGVDHTLDRMSLFLLLIALGGIAVAAGLGLVVSRAALAPVRRLTEATETVTQTGDLSERIDARGRGELGRLASRFNAMLEALEESASSQRRLVADASHELRTPLTSLRTNIEVLAGEQPLPPGERERLLSDVVEQLGEMTTLIAELIELARGEQHPAEAEDVRLDLLAAEAVERARRDRLGITFSTDLEESVVYGTPASIERAVANLIDNAAKWSPAGGEIEVGVHDGVVTVRDHGPGIEEEDLPHVFDRFYRASSARKLPGSGLGLAIVKQVAEAHGGEVVAERAEGGGTRIRLRLDGAEARPPEAERSS